MVVVAHKGFSLCLYFNPSTMGTEFMSNWRVRKLVSLMCVYEEFVDQLLPKLKGTWKLFLVALMSAGRGKFRNVCGLPIPTSSWWGQRGGRGRFWRRGWRKFTLSSGCATYARHTETCLSPILCSSFICLQLWIDLVWIKHSCCNSRALILAQLYFHEEADKKTHCWPPFVLLRRLMVTGHHLIHLQVQHKGSTGFIKDIGNRLYVTHNLHQLQMQLSDILYFSYVMISVFFLYCFS